MARIARGEELIESALAVIASATTVEQLRQAQAVAMPLCGLSLEMTAKLTGLSAGWVSKSRNRFLRGKPVGDASEPARGGRRRQHFSVEQEAKLLEHIVMALDGTGWHRSHALVPPANMRLLHLPPYAPELNPVEHIWDKLREKCFHNKVFNSIGALVDHLAMGLLAMENSPAVIKTITD